MAKPDKDVTHLIERLDVFEERAGVRLEALSAILVGFYNYETVQVYGEVHAQTGTSLARDVEITGAVYDADGKIVAARSCRITAAGFFGFEVFGLQLNGPMQKGPVGLAKIRIIPKADGLA